MSPHNFPHNYIWCRKLRHSYGTTTRLCRETEYVANTRIFGLLFYSDLTQTNEI